MELGILNKVETISRSVSTLQKLFDCPICLDMVTEPVRVTGCGHTFCKGCIQTILKSDSKKKLCPLCNSCLSRRSVSDDEKTALFLQLTLELISSINSDMGVDVTEHRHHLQSTNEASGDSEEFFKPRKYSMAHKVSKRSRTCGSFSSGVDDEAAKVKVRSNSKDFVTMNIKAVSTKRKNVQVSGIDSQSTSGHDPIDITNTSDFPFKKPFVEYSSKSVSNKVSDESSLIVKNDKVLNEVSRCDVVKSIVNKVPICEQENVDDGLSNLQNGAYGGNNGNNIPFVMAGPVYPQRRAVPFVLVGRLEGTTGVQCGNKVFFVNSVKLLNGFPNCVAVRQHSPRANRSTYSGFFRCDCDRLIQNNSFALRKDLKDEELVPFAPRSLHNYWRKQSTINEAVTNDADIECDMFGDHLVGMPPSVSQVQPRGAPSTEVEMNANSQNDLVDANDDDHRTVINMDLHKKPVTVCKRQEVDLEIFNNVENDVDTNKMEVTSTIESVNEVVAAINNKKDLANVSVDINKVDAKNNVTLSDISIVENSEPFINRLKSEFGISRKVKFSNCNGNSKQVSNLTDDLPEECVNETDLISDANATIITDSDNEDSDDGIIATPNIIPQDMGSLLSQRVMQKEIGSVVMTDSETNDVPSSLNELNGAKASFLSRIGQRVPSVCVEDSCRLSQMPQSEADKSMTSETLSESNIATIGEMRNAKRADASESDSFATNKRNLSFVFSRLTEGQLKQLKMLAFAINADITGNIMDGMTTHVIVRPDEQNRAPHTFKYLKGVASRLWVVSDLWISDCLQANKLLPEDKYLVLDSSGEPGPARCKMLDAMPPLHRFIVVPLPPFSSTTTEQVIDLIKFCGGEIVSIELLKDETYKFGIPRILLMDSDTDHQTIEMWLQNYRLVPLNVEWLLEVVGQYRLVSINSYTIAPYPKKLLHFLSIPDEIVGEDEDDAASNKSDVM